MKILVLSGSPKGEQSVTLQYARYLAKHRPAHHFEIVHLGLSVRALERNTDRFDAIMAQARAADLVLWCTPVYHLLVPSQLKRFIELVHLRACDAFRGKFAAALLSSIHFYDHTACNYLRAVSEDLGMAFFDAYSAHMTDLTKEDERARLLAFADAMLEAIAQGCTLPRAFAPLPAAPAPYPGGAPTARHSLQGKRLTLVADHLPPGSSLARMVERFASSFDGACEVVELASVDIKGGCLGCCHCALDNDCTWSGKDGFREFYEEKVKPADALVFAGTLQDRALSSLWKTYFDRSFYNNHVPVYRGKQMAWIVSGPLSANANLRQVMEVYPDLMPANLLGIVSDEGEPGQVGAVLDGLAARLAGDLARGYIRPQSFLGLAGSNLLRDEVLAGLSFLFRADHRWFKQHGVYDTLPHRRWLARLRSALLGPVFALPPVKRRLQNTLKAKMVEPAARVVEEA
jgi:multimeric flavodoxin WrbA